MVKAQTKERMSTPQQNRRDIVVDLIKTIAILGVLVIHTYSGVNSKPVTSFDWLAGNFYGCLMRASVPLFLMCSGVLFFNSEKDISIKKIYTKNIFRIVVAMLFWATSYKMFHLLVGGKFTLANIWSSIKEVVFFNHETHFYYLHITLLIYALVPVIRVFTKNADKRMLEYALAIWFVLGILYPAVSGIWPITLLSGIPVQWKLNLVYASIGYCLMGHYIKKHPLKLSTSIISAVVGFAYTYGGTVYLSMKQGSLNSSLINGNSLGVCLLAVGVFGICCACGEKIGDGAKKFVVYISKASFCIYLVHLFVIYCLSGIDINVNIMPGIISVPILSAVTLALSIVVYIVLSHIPVVKKWLI